MFNKGEVVYLMAGSDPMYVLDVRSLGASTTVDVFWMKDGEKVYDSFPAATLRREEPLPDIEADNG